MSIVKMFDVLGLRKAPASSVFFEGRMLQLTFGGGNFWIECLEARFSSVKILFM